MKIEDLPPHVAGAAVRALDLLASIAVESNALERYAKRFDIREFSDYVSIGTLCGECGGASIDDSDLVNLAIVLLEVARRHKRI